MNRIDQTLGFGEALLHTDGDHPVEALLLDRERLISVLRSELFALHNERRRQEGTNGHAEIVQCIRYFDAILGWIQGQPPQLILIGRRRTS